jgi:hypothetical protein
MDTKSQSESKYVQATQGKITTATTNGQLTQRKVKDRPPRRNRKAKMTRPCTFKSPSRKSPQHQKTKVSNMSSEKWQTQARQFLTNWTPRHMDAYLAIPEVALEWNVDPG